VAGIERVTRSSPEKEARQREKKEAERKRRRHIEETLG
jgi:hypothetical protein